MSYEIVQQGERLEVRCLPASLGMNHVVRQADGRWSVDEDVRTPRVSYLTQGEAIDRARELGSDPDYISGRSNNEVTRIVMFLRKNLKGWLDTATLVVAIGTLYVTNKSTRTAIDTYKVIADQRATEIAFGPASIQGGLVLGRRLTLSFKSGLDLRKFWQSNSYRCQPTGGEYVGAYIPFGESDSSDPALKGARWSFTGPGLTVEPNTYGSSCQDGQGSFNGRAVDNLTPGLANVSLSGWGLHLQPDPNQSGSGGANTTASMVKSGILVTVNPPGQKVGSWTLE